MPNRGSPVQLQLCVYMMVLVLVTGSHSFPVGLLPRSVHRGNFAQLKQHGYVVKHAVVHGLDSRGLKPRIFTFCLSLNATAIAGYNFYCFHFLMTVKSWLWVAVGEQLCLAIYGSERHVAKRKKKKSLLQWWNWLKVAQWAGLHPCPEPSFRVGK